MTAAILDASALLALLLGEPGGAAVQAVLVDSAMSMVNLAEVVGHFARHGVADPEIRRVLEPLPIAWIVFDADLAYL
jgi:PIN domain nuclease of toxin-antitoxin system